MKKAAILVLILLMSTASFAQKKPKIKGNKEVVEIDKLIYGEFNAIEIDDALEVSLTQGRENSYNLKTDENLLDIVQFSIRDSILKVYTTNRITSSKKLEIKLTIKEIEHIILKNDAEVKGEGRFSSDKLYLSAYNSSKFDLDIKADDVTVTMHRNSEGKLIIRSENATLSMNDKADMEASIVCDKLRVTLTKDAELKLDGDADYAAFNLIDDAKLDARKMKVSSADLYTSNSTDVYINAKDNLELYAQGKSNVYVYGDPKIDLKGLTDKSKIIKK